MIRRYFKSLYARTIREAYGRAHREIAGALAGGGRGLDCGSYDGHKYEVLSGMFEFPRERYVGVEWDIGLASKARAKGLEVVRSDLNRALPFPDGSFSCVFGLSVLEHLLMPCRHLRECHRVLEPGGTLVILTPNIATWFTALLILMGKMPSSGPHPDSDLLVRQETPLKVSHEDLGPDTESDMPVHRHLVVFSYRVLKSYVRMLGFRDVRAYGYGVYPFPNLLQPVLERIDPWHAHQMVVVARK